MDPTLASVLAILNTVDDPSQAVEAVKSLVANLDDSSDAPLDEVPVDAARPAALPVAAKSKKLTVDRDALFSALGIKASALEPNAPNPAPAAPGPLNDPGIPGSPPGTKPGPGTPDPAPPTLPEPVPAPNRNPSRAPAAPVTDPVKQIRAEAALATKQVQDAMRDHLIATEGDRLTTSVRAWATTQPLDVVKGVIGASPARTETPVRAHATRGDGQGAGAPAQGLQGAELEEFNKAIRASAPKSSTVTRNPHTGDYVFPTLTPKEHRIAAAAKNGGK